MSAVILCDRGMVVAGNKAAADRARLWELDPAALYCPCQACPRTRQTHRVTGDGLTLWLCIGCYGTLLNGELSCGLRGQWYCVLSREGKQFAIPFDEWPGRQEEFKDWAPVKPFPVFLLTAGPPWDTWPPLAT